jgi:hypothetical protein
VGRALLALTLAVVTVAGSGCSLIFARGPELERQPPEPCTSSNGYAIADTTLAAVSVAAVVGGSIAVADSTKARENKPAEGVAGLGLIGVGVIGTAIFVPSAVLGYNRAAACRAWLETQASLVPSPSRTSSTSQPGDARPARSSVFLAGLPKGASLEMDAVALERR